MGFLNGLADKIRENADRKYLEQWASPSYRKSDYDKWKGFLRDKQGDELINAFKDYLILVPEEYRDECIEYFGFTQKTSSPRREKTLEEELDAEREYGYKSLFTSIGSWEAMEEEKFKKAWTLLTTDEQEKYKLWKDISDKFFDCRKYFDSNDDDFKTFDTATRNENIYRLLQSYEAEGKTSEIEMALIYMKEDEKEAYKAKKATAASAPKAIPQPQAPVQKQPVAVPSPAPVVQAPASAEDELEAKLAKLKNLFDKGLISQEDFDKKKSDLLMNL